ncbi:MAG: preprotein translocase subunit SecA [bacterium]
MKDWIPFFDRILSFLFGSKQERDLKRLRPMVELVSLFERTVFDRSDEWLLQRTQAYQELLADGVTQSGREEYYLKQLEEAASVIQSVDQDELADNFRSRLSDNRSELLEKYEGDAFQGAIEAPLKPDNVDTLVGNQIERLEQWEEEYQEGTESVKQRFMDLWSHFLEKGPDPDDEVERQLWLLLPEAFAVVREAAHRRLGLRHYDVQVLGGIALHEGRITEMKTGEGKTLAATMPLYLNAITGKGAHLVTVNDYLARRDARWMGEIYEKLGMTVGLIQDGMEPGDRRDQYEAHITYGTNNEFGFDYLRDNMAVEPDDVVQPDRNFAIIDEVDSVLIDEARTPLIISGPSEKPTQLYKDVDRAVRQLSRDDHYEVDEKKHNVNLLEPGVDKIESIMDIENLFDTSNMDMVHHINQGIVAHELYERDSEYVVQDGEVIIVDEFTGRLQPGRRFSEGLHQAIEAKEGVEIEQENQTLATITIQNFFRMYEKLAGMTGTADTEAEEFQEIYDLDVVVVPTNEPDIREDYEDAIYRTREEKFQAVVDEIEELHEAGKPVLVGTVDIEKSELIGRMLDRKGISHNILNAKHHEKEAAIIAEAGKAGAVTIATNMAGRGTDIVLGENVIEDGCPLPPDNEGEDPYCPHDPTCGLHVIGTERHEARRVDNQLRGRTARQGDPGASRFFVSLEDDLMRLFGSDKISGVLESLGLEEGQRIEHSWISKSIKRAQSKVENRNFEIRKNLLEYDNVVDKQRSIIYEERRKALFQDDVSDTIDTFIESQVEEWVEFFGDEKRPAEDWPLSELLNAVEALTGWEPTESTREKWKRLQADELEQRLYDKIMDLYGEKEEEIGEESMRDVERQLLLQTIDTHWKEHLTALNNLKQGIHLEGMAQRDPLVEYKRKSFDMFQELQTQIRQDLIEFLLHVETVSEMEMTGLMDSAEFEHEEAGDLEELFEQAEETTPEEPPAEEPPAQEEESHSPVQTVVNDDEEVGRNDPCPCGSGQKYKYCCGP